MTLIVDSESPSGLKRSGRVAGYKHASGYWVVRLAGRKWYSHRLVYTMIHGEIPEGMEIDHIDGDKDNNSVENLRCVTPSVNSRNKPMQLSNTSGVTCVFHREVKGKWYWIARWRVGEKTKERHFSCNKYGVDKAKEMAVSLRDAMIAQDGMYTERHGK